MAGVDQPHENFVFPEEVLPRGNAVNTYLVLVYGVCFAHRFGYLLPADVGISNLLIRLWMNPNHVIQKLNQVMRYCVLTSLEKTRGPLQPRTIMIHWVRKDLFLYENLFGHSDTEVIKKYAGGDLLDGVYKSLTHLEEW